MSLADVYLHRRQLSEIEESDREIARARHRTTQRYESTIVRRLLGQKISALVSAGDYSSKDVKLDLCRLLVKGKEDDPDKFEMKIGVMRTVVSRWLAITSHDSLVCLAEMQMEHAKCALAAAIKFLQVRGTQAC